MEWVPGKTDPRLKVLQRRIVLEGLMEKTGTLANAESVSYTSARILPNVLQVIDFAISFCRNR